MNKYQDAIKWLEYIFNLMGGEFVGDHRKSLQELVDKETPKKVKNWLRDKSVACCPICNMSDYAEEKSNYCSHCGQALDWTE